MIPSSPKAILSADEGRENVDAYGDCAKYRTPLENPYVRRVLEELGLNTVEELQINVKATFGFDEGYNFNSLKTTIQDVISNYLVYISYNFIIIFSA